jgi:SAM-dependent methyltransferase
VSTHVWGEESAREYDEVSAGMFAAEVLEPTVRFLADLAGGGRALELAIGTGRVAIPLLERGVEVAGIELSEPMVAVLRRKIDADRLPVTIGDMASVAVPGSFRLVYLVYNTITNLLTQDAQVACFRNAARHLEPGGRFAVEVFVPQLRRLPPGQLACPFDVTDEHLGFDSYDLVAQRLVSHHYWRRAGRTEGPLLSPHRYVWPAELDLMARLTGLVLEQRVADWNGSPFDDDSPSHVSVWRKPAVGEATSAAGQEHPG